MQIDIKQELRVLVDDYANAPQVYGGFPVTLRVLRSALAEIERLEHCIGTWLEAEEAWNLELAECKRQRDALTDRMIAAGLMS